MKIQFNNLSFKYPQSNSGLNAVNLTIPKNKLTVIVGENGSGKSTIAKLIDGLLLPDDGEIIFDKKVINHKSKEKDFLNIRNQIGFVFQQPEKQLFASTVLQDVSFALKNFNLDETLAVKALKEMGIEEELFDKNVFELSTGQQRKVALAGIFVYDPKIIIYDEPTLGLDYPSQIEIFNLIKQQQNQDKTQIVITHDLDRFIPIADDIIYLENQKVLSQGDAQTVFAEAKKLEPTFIKAARVLKLKKIPSSIHQLKRYLK